MKYSLELTASAEDADKLIDVARLEEGKRDRAELAIEKKGKSVVFQVKSADHIALKASMNTVSKILSIYEKTQTLVDEDGR
jgi:tRNA threonylcarbamoyladenosine modification (KEOPS) complex  Pcc1 subunit